MTALGLPEGSDRLAGTGAPAGSKHGVFETSDRTGPFAADSARHWLAPPGILSSWAGTRSLPSRSRHPLPVKRGGSSASTFAVTPIEINAMATPRGRQRRRGRAPRCRAPGRRRPGSQSSTPRHAQGAAVRSPRRQSRAPARRARARGSGRRERSPRCLPPGCSGARKNIPGRGKSLGA